VPTYAAIVIDVTAPDQPVLAVLDVPAWQWAGDYWPDLASRCPLRVAVGDGARSSNRLHLDPLTPADRCGDQSPDGRGRAWLDSGGSPLAYGRCARGGCPLAR